MKDELKKVLDEAGQVEKVLTLVMMPCSLAVLILAILQLVGIWEDAINVYEPLLGVMMLCQAGIAWKKNRKAAYLYLGVAALIFIVAIFVLL
jgi:hypothetical protein